MARKRAAFKPTTDLHIERVSRRFRTLHPPRRSWAGDVPPPLTLDDYVTITLARVHWMERAA